MTTVLDYQLNGTILENITEHLETKGWKRRIRSMEDLKQFFGRYPDDKKGNRAAAVELWGYRYSKRMWQLRRLVELLEKSRVTDLPSLREWAHKSC
ncbi:MAG: hypothetical protein ABIL25_01225 [candidate division WOR-3 bacterium]